MSPSGVGHIGNPWAASNARIEELEKRIASANRVIALFMLACDGDWAGTGSPLEAAYKAVHVHYADEQKAEEGKP